jgi:putative ABC transport system substrate-binding protein
VRSITRRHALAGAIVALVLPPTAHAQPARKIARIGFLDAGGYSSEEYRGTFRDALGSLGYVEGRNIAFEYRSADGELDRLAHLAADLVKRDLDILVSSATQATLAAKHATRTIPIVMVGVGDPVGAGIVRSLAHPGGNVTGTSGMNTEVVGKSLQLLAEVLPKASRVAVLWNPRNPVFHAQMLKEAQASARTRGLQLDLFEARTESDLDQVFAAMAKHAPSAVLVLPDPLLTRHRVRVMGLAARHRLPSMGGNRLLAEAGGMMSYGPEIRELFRRAATYVDKILKGAKPSELPVEQVTTFELVINIKTARALGVTIPPVLLARADRVIE